MSDRTQKKETGIGDGFPLARLLPRRAPGARGKAKEGEDRTRTRQPFRPGGGFLPSRAAAGYDRGGARGRNRQAAGASIPWPARVAASRESRAGRPRVRRAPEAPAARRFPVPRTACAQDARPPYREVGWLVGSEGRKARIATARFGRCEARRKRERRKPLQTASEKVLRGSFRRKRRGLPNREPAAKTTANSQA